MSKYAMTQQLSKKSPRGVVIHRDEWMGSTPEMELLDKEF